MGGYQVRNAGGEVMQEITIDRKVHTVPVKPGDDGSPWSITGLSLARLYFFNIPNYVAASPNALMVPREVAVADKLIIVK